MSEQGASEKRSLVSTTVLVTALVFGAITMVIMLSGFHIPIPGGNVVTDPREIFVTLGSALTGPIGGALIGSMSGIFDPTEGWTLIVMLYHAVGGIWMGFAYKKLVHEHLEMPVALAGWVGLVLAYYYVFMVPISIYVTYLTKPAVFEAIFGASAPSLDVLLGIFNFVLPEAILTSVITALILAALPRKYHQPLW